MLNFRTSLLAVMVMLFSLTAFAAEPAAGASAPAPQASLADELASDPAKVLPARIRPDSMGNLFAVVQNPTSAAMANVFVIVLHLNEKSGQPDRQTSPMLVAKKLAPGRAAQIPLPGAQVYRRSELELYKAIVVRAELAK